jgi:hypothetical protein
MEANEALLLSVKSILGPPTLAMRFETPRLLRR